MAKINLTVQRQREAMLDLQKEWFEKTGFLWRNPSKFSQALKKSDTEFKDHLPLYAALHTLISYYTVKAEIERLVSSVSLTSQAEDPVHKALGKEIESRNGRIIEKVCGIIEGVGGDVSQYRKAALTI